MTRPPHNSPRLALVSLHDVLAFGVRSLHAFLRARGHHVETVFFQRNQPRRRFGIPDQALAATVYAPVLRLLADLRPDLVGVSLFAGNVPAARALTRLIKQQLDVPVLWGGIHPTIQPDSCLEHADLVCVGDGELPLARLLTAMAQGLDPTEATISERIPNLRVRDAHGSVHSFGTVRLEDLDDLPHINYAEEGYHYIRGTRVLGHWAYPLEVGATVHHTYTARGCPYRCSFCAAHVVKKMHPKRPAVRRRSVDHVIEELVQARRRNSWLQRIYFWDDVFLLNKTWLREFTTRYAKEVGLPFCAHAHPHAIDEQALRWAVDAGLATLCVGIQGGPTLSRSIFNRPYDRDRLLAAAHLLRKSGVTPVYDIIQANPLATSADQLELLELLLQLPRPFRLNTHDLKFYPGYEISNMARQRGVLSPDATLDSPTSALVMDGALFPTRPRALLAWEGLYFLCGRSWVPPEVIRAVGRSEIYRKYARELTFPLFVADRASRAARRAVAATWEVPVKLLAGRQEKAQARNPTQRSTPV